MGGVVAAAIDAGCALVSSCIAVCIRCIAIVQLIDLSGAEAVDGNGIAKHVLAFHRQGDAAGAAMLAIIVVPVTA